MIHTVGPVWNGGHQGEPELLASCYRKSLDLATSKGIKTIAFPAISCGIHDYPVDQAARIAFNEVSTFLSQNDSIEKVFLVCFSDDVLQAYQHASEAQNQ